MKDIYNGTIQGEKRRVLIKCDDMIADIISKNKISPSIH